MAVLRPEAEKNTKHSTELSANEGPNKKPNLLISPLLALLSLKRTYALFISLQGVREGELMSEPPGNPCVPEYITEPHHRPHREIHHGH